MRSGVDLLKVLEKVDPAVYGAEFSSFASAKRLELLPAYNVPSEGDALRKFIESGELEETFNSGWHKILRDASTRGASVQRLRAVSAPPSDYLRFELMAYDVNARHGEEIRLLDASALFAAAEPYAPLLDFWVFDDSRIYFPIYDARGTYMGPLRGDAEACHDYSAFFDRLYRDAPGL